MVRRGGHGAHESYDGEIMAALGCGGEGGSGKVDLREEGEAERESRGEWERG